MDMVDLQSDALQRLNMVILKRLVPRAYSSREGAQHGTLMEGHRALEHHSDVVAVEMHCVTGAAENGFNDRQKVLLIGISPHDTVPAHFAQV